MRDASKPVPPQPEQADLLNNRPPVTRLCALFVAAMATVHAVQTYDERQQLKNQEASAPEVCLQEQWQPASVQNGELSVVKAEQPTTPTEHKKSCPEFTPPVS